MTDEEKANVQELLDSLDRCYIYYGHGEGRCQEIAMMSHPTEVIGDFMLRCKDHPGPLMNKYGDTAQTTLWAAVVERFVAQGFRSSK